MSPHASPVGLPATGSIIQHLVGATGIKPAPNGLKGRHAVFTPRTVRSRRCRALLYFDFLARHRSHLQFLLPDAPPPCGTPCSLPVFSRWQEWHNNWHFSNSEDTRSSDPPARILVIVTVFCFGSMWSNSSRRLVWHFQQRPPSCALACFFRLAYRVAMYFRMYSLLFMRLSIHCSVEWWAEWGSNPQLVSGKNRVPSH